MDTILQTTFEWIIFYQNWCILIEISLECVPNDQINNNEAMVEIMGYCRGGGVKTPLKLGHGLLTAPYRNDVCDYTSMPNLHVSKRAPMSWQTHWLRHHCDRGRRRFSTLLSLCNWIPPLTSCACVYSPSSGAFSCKKKMLSLNIYHITAHYQTTLRKEWCLTRFSDVRWVSMRLKSQATWLFIQQLFQAINKRKHQSSASLAHFADVFFSQKTTNPETFLVMTSSRDKWEDSTDTSRRRSSTSDCLVKEKSILSTFVMIIWTQTSSQNQVMIYTLNIVPLLRPFINIVLTPKHVDQQIVR